MREIKFRAWGPWGEWTEDGEKQKNIMLYGDELAFEEYEPINGLLKSVENLMQYTGLKDKNGKEIYEGDIVQRGIITFSRGKFQGTYFDGSGNMEEDWEDDLYQERDIEVLGNVYENPELLTDPE